VTDTWLLVASLVGLALAVAALSQWRSRRIETAQAEPERRRPAPLPLLPSLAGGDSGVDEDMTVIASAIQPRAAASSAYGAPAIASLLEEMIREAQRGLEKPEVAVPIELNDGESRAILICDDEVPADEPTGPVARIALVVHADSDQGRTRKRNEDSFLILERHAVFVVADGMGGHEGGQVASSLAVESIRSAFVEESSLARPDWALPRSARELVGAILSANRAVFDAARSQPALSEMGTTLVAARFAPNKQRLYLGHVGDSRCYRLRDGALSLLTTDHTLGQLGLIGPSANHLSRAIGIDEHLSIDVVVDRPQPRDIYLLCTDGLSKMLSAARIREILLGEHDLEAAVYGLIEQANDAGGKDNVTVVLVQVEDAAVERPSRATQSMGQQG
jgi:serine/threonine protein phosphatase PrpC